MKIVFTTGEVRYATPVEHCTGYRAKELVLDHNDLRSLCRLDKDQLFAVVQQLAARVPKGTPSDQESLMVDRHANLLCEALGKCLVAAGIVRPDASLTGPEVLLAADDLETYLKIKSSPLSAEKPADYFASLVAKARPAAAKASIKYPQPNYVVTKIAEEAGEVVRGGVHYAENRMEWSEVEGEIIQLLAMLIRFVTEGDEVIGAIPPISTRI